MLSMCNIGKSFALILILIMAISSLIVIDLMSFGLAQTGTSVNGIITSDTTWTRANSPYNLTTDVLVSNGVTLTIQSGTTININNYNLEANGTLQAIGTTNSPIVFTNGEIVFGPNSAAWNGQSQTGCIITNSDLDNCGINIMASSPIIQNSEIAGQPIGVNGGSPTISNNTINIPPQRHPPSLTYEQSFSAISLAYNNSAVITNNVITGEFQKGAINLQEGSPIVEGNLIIANSGLSFQSGASSGTIMNNTFSTSKVITGDITTTGPINATIIYNNFENLSSNGVVWGATSNLNLTYNWWGTIDTQVINQTIYDSKHNFNLGTVTFIPFLTAPNPQAPNSNTVIPTTIPISTPSSSQNTTPSPTPPVPEFPTLIILPLFAVVLLISMMLMKRRTSILR